MALQVDAPRSGPIAGINVTPMADVMIVLLIILMVAVPLFDADPELRLPGASSGSEARPDASLTLSLRRDASLWIGAHAFPDSAAAEAYLVERLSAAGPELRVVWLKADESLPYAEIDDAMAACRRAGAERVALMAEPAVGGES